jgi:hypothetical protein
MKDADGRHKASHDGQAVSATANGRCIADDASGAARARGRNSV